MKKADIGVGRFYTDGKNGLRQVIAEGAQYKLYDAVADCDCLRYRSITSSGGVAPGNESNSTRVAFAAWAKSEVAADQTSRWLLTQQARSIEKKLTAPQRGFLSLFDDDLSTTSSVSCERQEFRLAKVCRDKGLIADLPEALSRGDDHFDVEFSALGIAVIQKVHAIPET